MFSRLLRKTRKANGERGQSVAEFAISLPVLLIMLLAIVAFVWRANATVIPYGWV